ncbi:hypothetical protein EDD17DRAFT_44296 [Pisolithus thermaeus]|nr:hypothetical protein EDD17DRAFT_44296 [Pisolithus thermaeus]
MMLWLGAMQVAPINKCNHGVLCKKKRLGISTIRLVQPRHARRLSATPLSGFVGNFSVRTLPKRHGHPRRVRFFPHRGFNLCHVIWHNDTSGTYVYYMHYPEDAATIKFLVAAIWILDTLHVSFMCHALYYYLITNYGVTASLEYIIWSFQASVLMNLLVILVVQFFFAHKIHYFCRRRLRWLLIPPIILFILAQIGFGMWIFVLLLVDNKTSMLTRTWYYGVTPSTAAGALADILITVSLCVFLYDSGSRSEVPRTKSLVSGLIAYAVNRCLLTLLVVISQMAANADQQPAWTMALDFIIGKLYANSLLGSLNARQYLLSQGSGTMPNPNISAIHFADMPKLSGVIGSCKDGRTWFDVREVTAIDITTEPAFDNITTLQRGAENDQ